MVLKALGFVALFSLYLLKRLTFSSKTADSCFCVYVGYPIIFFFPASSLIFYFAAFSPCPHLYI